MKVDVLLGLQWGDEGKGKVVDVLAGRYDGVARFQGGPNAGHTLEFNGIKHVLHIIPSGIFHESKLNVIGNGVLIEPHIFEQEVAALREKNVDVNSLTALYGKFDKGLWSAVAVRSPVMRFVKYLAKFIREGVLTDEMLKAKVNVEALKKAKVFPFRLYTAYRAVSRELERKERKVLAYLAEVMNDYAKTYDWSAFGDKKWVIAPDVSGSMCSPIGESSVLSYAAVSAMFVGFFTKGLGNVTVLPWDTQVRPYGVSASEPVMVHIDAITSMVEGGTYMETGVKHMIRNRIETDYAVFLTDTEEYGSGWLAAWKDYHRRYPKAVAFVLRGDSYKTSPIDEKTAKELNVYQIFGWNDSVIDYMKFVIGARKDAA